MLEHPGYGRKSLMEFVDSLIFLKILVNFCGPFVALLPHIIAFELRRFPL